jgi:ferredoxin
VEGKFVLDRQDFDSLFHSLHANGYEVIGPTVMDNAVVYTSVNSSKDLPSGWTDEQSGGIYRLKKSGNDALFGYSAAPQSWKKFLFMPALCLGRASRNGNGFQAFPLDQQQRKTAFLGVRACELKAIAIQDEIFMRGQYVDRSYTLLRRNALIVAVQCSRAGDTCFCASMDAGPRVTHGYDLSLTEMLAGGRHFFLIEAGTDRGVQILQQIPHKTAQSGDIEMAERLLDDTAGKMGRVLDTADIKGLLYRNYEHPRWVSVSQRCLACTNCTIVCPTCFCSKVEDVTDLTGAKAERWRRWDSCFTMDHSYIHGGSIRSSVISRYRQWMSHKLATWIDQFGTSGCVGCGRCITWCPVGIDITEETNAIRSSGDVSRSLFGKKGEKP